MSFAAALLLCSCTPADESKRADDTSHIGKATTEVRHQSRHLDAEVVVAPGVFTPGEAEFLVLPFMKESAPLFAG